MPRSVVDFDKRGGGSKVSGLPNQNAQRLEQAAHALLIKTGFLSTPAVTLSFVDGTRTFTIAPTGTTFNVWVLGVKYTKTSETVVITDTEGLWYIYYDLSILTASQTPWDNRDNTKTSVAIIYWDATANHHHYLGYECHSFEITPVTHDYIHHVFGTMYASGLALVAGTGGDDGKVALDGGNIWDQDILIEITDGAGSGLFEQELGNTSSFAPAQIPVFYRSGASDWERYDAGDFPFYDNATVDNVHYNSYSAPNWASTAAASSSKYIAMWIMGTNNQTEPVIAIMGQIESNTLNAAKDANTFESIDFGTLPFTEMKVLYRVIFRSNSTWSHTEDLRTLANVPGGTYVPLTHPISDDVYGVDWGTVTTIAPSKKSVYDAVLDEDDMASDSDVHWATQQSIKAFVNAKRVTVPLHVITYLGIDNTIDWFLMIESQTTGNWLGGNFFIDDNVDTSKDIVFTMTFACDDNDASVAQLLYVGAHKTDNSEDHGLYNIENATGITLDSTIREQVSKYQYTVANADFETDDVIKIGIKGNEGGRRIFCYSMSMTYYLV